MHYQQPSFPNRIVNGSIRSRYMPVTDEGARWGQADSGQRRAGEMVWRENDADAEPAIKVLMDRDRVVFRPVGHLDRDSIETLAGLVDSARRAGVSAVVDLDAIEPDELPGGDVLALLVADGSSNSSHRI